MRHVAAQAAVDLAGSGEIFPAAHRVSGGCETGNCMGLLLYFRVAFSANKISPPEEQLLVIRYMRQVALEALSLHNWLMRAALALELVFRMT